jgi:hypothetical protein
MVVSLSNPKATTEDRAGVRGPLLDLLVCLQLYNYWKRTHRRVSAFESATQAEARDDRAVALDVGLLQVVQETTTLAHEQ